MLTTCNPSRCLHCPRPPRRERTCFCPKVLERLGNYRRATFLSHCQVRASPGGLRIMPLFARKVSRTLCSTLCREHPWQMFIRTSGGFFCILVDSIVVILVDSIVVLIAFIEDYSCTCLLVSRSQIFSCS